MTLARWLIVVFTVTIVALFLAGAMIYYLSWKKDGQDRLHNWQAYAQSHAWQLETRTKMLQALVQGFSEDPQVVEASLTGGDLRKAEETRLARIIPFTIEVDILPPGLGSEQRNLSYADLDLVRQAEEKPPFPSIHGAGSSQRYIAVAHAIRSGKLLTGVLLVKLDLKWLQQAMPDPGSGAIALMQGKLMLFYHGKPELRQVAAAGTIPVKGTMWQLGYWVPAPDWRDHVALLLPQLVAMALIAGTLFWFARWLGRAFWHDVSMLFTVVNDMVDGTFRGSYRLKLRELQSLVDKLLISFESGRDRGLLVRREPVKGLQEQPGQPEGEEPVSEEPLVSMTASREEEETPESKPAHAVEIPQVIFRPCDIRGEVDDTLTPEVAQQLGQAIGSEVQAQGEQVVLVGCDSRSSSESLKQSLIQGLQSTGRDIIDLGVIPVPILYFATHYLTHHSGVMVTGSSSPATYNGLKVVVNGKSLSGEELVGLGTHLQRNEISSGMGMLESQDLLADYVGYIIDDVQIGRPLKVVVDSGAGEVGDAAVALLRTLGCEVEALQTEGLLDPTDPGALKRLMAKVRKDEEAELGLAFDGDGDRLVVVDANGNWVSSDLVLMLLAADALSRQPGADVVFDIECSRHVARYIMQQGGHPVQVAPGYCNLLAKMDSANEVVMAGGFGGHLVFKERWFGTADALYAAARLVEVLSAEPMSSDEVFAELPQSPSTPRLLVPMSDGEVDKTIRLLESCSDKFFSDAKVDTTHGVRVDFANGWGSVRASSSLPALVFRFEGDDRESLLQIRERFQQLFDTIEVSLSLPPITLSHDG